MGILAEAPHDHLSRRAGILHTIVDEVVECLANGIGVEECTGKRIFQFGANGKSLVKHAMLRLRDDILDQRFHVHSRPGHFSSAFLHPGKVEHVVDEHRQAFALLNKDVVVATPSVLRWNHVRLEHLGQLAYRRERALELVGHRRDEIRLHASQLQLSADTSDREYQTAQQDAGEQQKGVEIHRAP